MYLIHRNIATKNVIMPTYKFYFPLFQWMTVKMPVGPSIQVSVMPSNPSVRTKAFEASTRESRPIWLGREVLGVFTSCCKLNNLVNLNYYNLRFFVYLKNYLMISTFSRTANCYAFQKSSIINPVNDIPYSIF